MIFISVVKNRKIEVRSERSELFLFLWKRRIVESVRVVSELRRFMMLVLILKYGKVKIVLNEFGM